MGEEVKPSKSSEKIVGISPEALYEPILNVLTAMVKRNLVVYEPLYEEQNLRQRELFR
jgi:hypothetical protein